MHAQFKLSRVALWAASLIVRTRWTSLRGEKVKKMLIALFVLCHYTLSYSIEDLWWNFLSIISRFFCRKLRRSSLFHMTKPLTQFKREIIEWFQSINHFLGFDLWFESSCVTSASIIFPLQPSIKFQFPCDLIWSGDNGLIKNIED